MRNDCEQMSGKCICKPGIKGDKCDICPDETQISPSGCEGRKFDARKIFPFFLIDINVMYQILLQNI